MLRIMVFSAAVLVLFCTPIVRADVAIETVTVGNPGNADDTHHDGYGAVDYIYEMGKYEVTAGQYTEFLNAVAVTDAYGLYNTDMSTYSETCHIERVGSSGSYTYTVQAEWANRPVTFVCWGDAARFANWLHNGQPATGAQDLGTTEDGSYYLDGATSTADLMAVVRKPGATWVVPSQDEWHKAGYHYNNGATGNYYAYSTSSDTLPDYVDNSGDLSGTGAPFLEGGTDPGNYVTYDGDEGINGIGSPHYRTVVGEWENSASPYGTFDQGGNVWEWTETIASATARGRRGGAYNIYAAQLHADHLGSQDPTFEWVETGLRVAKVPGQVPAVSEWGILAMVLLTMTAGTIAFTGRKRAVDNHVDH